jgi:large repetitive protein
MRRPLAAVLFLAAFTAHAGTISSIDPSTIQAFSGEHFITVRGQQLGNQLLFDGPAGTYEVEASSATGDTVIGWVPSAVVNAPGVHSVRVGGPGGVSNAVRLDVVEPPHALVILGQDPIVVQAEGPRGAHVSFEVPTYGGQDPNPVVRCDPPSGSLFPLGPNNVHCVATNSFGERAEGGVYIFVQDGSAPVLELPDDIVVDAETEEGTVVTFEASAHDDVDGELRVTCDPPSGTRFPVGITTVECTATDSSLNPVSGTFTVEVRSEEDPILLIQVPDPIVVEANGPAGSQVEFTVTTHGSTDPEPSVSCDPLSNSTFPLGTTTVTCTASDRFGGRAEGTFTVTVSDTTPPALDDLFDLTVQATGPGGAVVTFEPTATDLVDGSVEVSCSPASGSQFPVGMTTVQCTAEDAHGNEASGSFTVTVTEEPGTLAISVPGDIEVEADGPEGSVVEFMVTAESSSDPEPVVSCNPPSGSTFPIGRTTVVCTASDSAGRHAEGRFSVTVTEPGRLMIFVPDDIEAEAEGPDGAAVEFTVTAGGSNDPDPSVTCNPSSGSTFPLGETEVVCTATDDFGQEAVGTFTVTVSDTIDPMIGSISATPDVLAPPNHRLIDIEVTVEATDVVDPVPACRVFDVTANEPILGAGSGHTDFDWRITGALEVELRAERSGEGTDRVYKVHVVCTDASGNNARGSVEVTVPKANNSGGSATVEPPAKRRSVGRGR